jgi:hypothetical protein
VPTVARGGDGAYTALSRRYVIPVPVCGRGASPAQSHVRAEAACALCACSAAVWTHVDGEGGARDGAETASATHAPWYPRTRGGEARIKPSPVREPAEDAEDAAESVRARGAGKLCAFSSLMAAPLRAQRERARHPRKPTRARCTRAALGRPVRA